MFWIQGDSVSFSSLCFAQSLSYNFEGKYQIPLWAFRWTKVWNGLQLAERKTTCGSTRDGVVFLARKLNAITWRTETRLATKNNFKWQLMLRVSVQFAALFHYYSPHLATQTIVSNIAAIPVGECCICNSCWAKYHRGLKGHPEVTDAKWS